MSKTSERINNMPTWKKWIIRLLFWGILIAIVIAAPKLVAGIVAGFAIVALIAYWWIMRKIKKIFEPLQDLELFPTEVELSLIPQADWHFPDDISVIHNDLKSLGYTEIGIFEADKMKGVHIHAWLSNDQQSYAVVYDQEYMGAWTDFFAAYEDGSFITFTNTKMPQIFDRAPGKPMERMPESSVPDVHSAFLAYNGPAPLQSLSGDAFATIIETYFREERQWQTENFEEEAKMQEALEEAFLTESKWSAIEWNRKEDNVIFIHDKLRPHEVIDEYTSFLYIDEDGDLYDSEEKRANKLIDSMSPREAFAAIVADMPDPKIEKILEMETPLPTSVYLAPDPPEDCD